MTDLSEQARLHPSAQAFAQVTAGAAVQAAQVAQVAAGPDRVVFEQVGKTYRSGAATVEALHGVHFGIAPGEVFGIIGRSGAGKSTLLRAINRLESPSSGRVLVNGSDVAELDEPALRRLRRRIGMIFQHFNLLSAKTVWDNVALPLRVAGVPAAAIAQRVGFLLDLVGLADKRDVYPAKLSGGQKQRVGIARALVHEPDILLCDEATSALDPETTQSILALLRDINRRLGLTIVLITHEMAVIREICDRVAVLEKGRVVELGPVWSVFGAPQAEATLALLRPLVHALPAELAQDLVPLTLDAPLQPDWTLLLELRLTGVQQREFAFGPLARALGGPVELLHGGIDRIQGRPQGRLVLSARTALDSVATLLQVLQNSADTVAVLGRRTGEAHAA